MVFGGIWRMGGRRGRRRRRRGGDPYGGDPYGGYRRRGGRGRGGGGGGGCARNACLLEGGCCLGEALDGNCLLLSVVLLPQLLTALVRGHHPGLRPGISARISGRLLAAIGVYQQQISPHLSNRCRFEPSCSHYAAEAVTRHGSIRGSWLTLRRLLRCHPAGRRGLDPIPFS